ncbi:MAG: hypothetical protein ACJ8CB_13835 [Ktedonobacteraceae bacterium]
MSNIQRDEGRHVSFSLQILRYYAHKDERYAKRIREMYEEYLPLIRVRYGQKIVVGEPLGSPTMAWSTIHLPRNVGLSD